MKKFNNTIIIGIDHGYGNMKTASCCFPTGLIAYDSEPLFTKELLVYNGRYYLIGEEHKEYISDKSLDEDFYVLTLAAIAKELSTEKITEANIYIAAGLPLTWTSGQKADFSAYLMRNKEVSFTFHKQEYHFHIEGVSIYPQGYAAIAPYASKLTGVNVIADIGNGTMNVKLPRVLISEPLRSKLSDSAIVLYSYLLSLYELSVRNGERFRDENGRYYVVCPISTVMRLLNCCNNKAESVYMQLENQNLISRKRQGLGKANLIYVNPIVESTATYAKNALDLCKNIDSGNAKITFAEMGKTHTIKNDYYQKDLNNIYPSIRYEDVIEDIRSQIEYDVLAERGYGSVLDEIVSLLADTVTYPAETVRINQINIPIDKVRWRLKQLTAEHIEYVISSLEKNTTEIKNMRAYLLTALYNSIDTLDTAALYGA